MAWLHTWAGVVVGALLFLIFWTGTLCVFDREIDRWMIPQTRIVYDGRPFSIEPLMAEADKLRPKGPWAIIMPTVRDPYVWIAYRAAGGFERREFEPVTLRPLARPESWAGSRFFLPLHYTLHIGVWSIGMWIVGFAGMTLLALCVSGVVIHRKIFSDFFTLRRPRQPQRFLLDLHNVSGTVGLVFYVVMAFSGLVIFLGTYFPTGWQAGFRGDRQAYVLETFDNYARPAAHRPGSFASLDAMVAMATREWGGVPPIMIRFWHQGDANAYVEVRPTMEEEVAMRTDPIYFDAATGAMLHRARMQPTTAFMQFMTGIHFVQYRHWTLRWIYFGLGLLGCVLIATGLLFWIESRRKAHVAAGRAGVRVVERLAVGATAGLVLATVSFFVANRLLPAGASLFGVPRHGLEIAVFCLVWLAAFGHGLIVQGAAWAVQCRAAAVLAVTAVVLNAVTTGDHIPGALADGKEAVAGVDLVLLAGAAIAAATAWRLRRRPSEVAAAPHHRRHRLEGQNP